MEVAHQAGGSGCCVDWAPAGESSEGGGACLNCHLRDGVLRAYQKRARGHWLLRETEDSVLVYWNIYKKNTLH